MINTVETKEDVDKYIKEMVRRAEKHGIRVNIVGFVVPILDAHSVYMSFGREDLLNVADELLSTKKGMEEALEKWGL